MGKEKVVKNEGTENETVQVMPEAGPINLSDRVKVKVTGSPFHKDGDVIECAPHVANKMEANGWGKLITLALFMLASVFAYAQNTAYQVMKVHFANTNVLTDTVTNTATGYVSTLTAMVNPAYTTTVQIEIVKISGTVAGTVTLQGSLDGTNWSTATSGALAITATYTATDVATQSKNWIIVNNPYKYYRATWTGTGTMSATIAGRVWSH